MLKSLLQMLALAAVGWAGTAEWPIGTLLTRGKNLLVGTALGTGAQAFIDVLCGGDSTLVVEADMSATVNTDISVLVVPFMTDGINLMAGTSIGAVRSSAGINGPNVNFYGEWDVSAVDKVRIFIRNNNAGGETINRVSWRLS